MFVRFTTVPIVVAFCFMATSAGSDALLSKRVLERLQSRTV